MFIAAVLVVPAGGYWLWWRAAAPEVPPISLDGVEPAVAEAIRKSIAQVEEFPRSDQAWGILGMVLFAHGKADEARACFIVAEDLNPDEPRWPYLYAAADDVPDDLSLEKLARAVLLCGSETAPPNRYGEALIEMGEPDKAEGMFQHVLAIDPKDARAHLGMARVLLARQNFDQCLDHLRQSAALNPRVALTHRLMAEAYFRLGRKEEAEAERKRAAELPSNPFWTDRYLGEAMSLEAGPTALSRRADHLWENGDRRLAFDLASDTAKKFPDSPKALLVLGKILSENNQVQEAEPVLREVTRLDPESSAAWFYLANSLVAQGKDVEAAAGYRRAAEILPSDARAHYNLAQCLYRMGDFAAAIDSFQTAVRYKPDWPVAHRNLALLLDDRGRRAEAIDHAQKALDADPADAESRSLLERLTGSPAP